MYQLEASPASLFWFRTGLLHPRSSVATAAGCTVAAVARRSYGLPIANEEDQRRRRLSKRFPFFRLKTGVFGSRISQRVQWSAKAPETLLLCISRVLARRPPEPQSLCGQQVENAETPSFSPSRAAHR